MDVRVWDFTEFEGKIATVPRVEEFTGFPVVPTVQKRSNEQPPSSNFANQV